MIVWGNPSREAVPEMVRKATFKNHFNHLSDAQLELQWVILTMSTSLNALPHDWLIRYLDSQAVEQVYLTKFC